MSKSPKKLSDDELRTYFTLKYGGVLEALELTVEPDAKEIMGEDFDLIRNFARKRMEKAFSTNATADVTSLVDKKK